MKHYTSNNFGKAQTVKKTFSRTTSISQLINAKPSIVWKLITTANDYSKWNTTIISLDGDIRPNQTIQLKSSLDPTRVFKLKVKEFIPEQKLVWGDFMGQRTFTLEKQGDATVFSMSEKIGGPVFPLFASKIPSFNESFEQFTSDLKKAAEATGN